MATHIAPEYFHNPTHPITINLIGCGGNGSLMLTNLARLNHVLLELGHVGIHVKVTDPDIVENTNIGRQAFSPADIGRSKAIVSVERINQYFGFTWQAEQTDKLDLKANIIISAVDDYKVKNKINQMIRSFHSYYKKITDPKHSGKYWNSLQSHTTPYYWLDMGNTRDSGQVVLGTILHSKNSTSLPTIKKLFSNLRKYESKKQQGLSCSVAQSLLEQDLFINSAITNFAAELLSKLLRDKIIQFHGCFVNLSKFKVNPILIRESKA